MNLFDMKAQDEATRRNQRAYKCRHCVGWHLTTKERR